jgi:hypothetical protein
MGLFSAPTLAWDAGPRSRGDRCGIRVRPFWPVAAWTRIGRGWERVRDHSSAAAETLSQQTFISRIMASFSPPGPGTTCGARARPRRDRSGLRSRLAWWRAAWAGLGPVPERVRDHLAPNAELVAQHPFISRKMGPFSPPSLGRPTQLLETRDRFGPSVRNGSSGRPWVSAERVGQSPPVSVAMVSSLRRSARTAIPGSLSRPSWRWSHPPAR